MKLADISTQQSTIGSPFDLGEYLKADGEIYLLGILCEAYENLYSSRQISCEMKEPQINEELFKHLSSIWRIRGPNTLFLINEKSDNSETNGKGKSPTIDICFRDYWIPDSYFGIECKILTNIKKRYNYYIEGGVIRYTSGRYSKSTRGGAIVGYVFGDITKIINEVITRVKNLPEAPEMDISYPLSNFREHYKSVHVRANGCSPFDLHHFFFYFT